MKSKATRTSVGRFIPKICPYCVLAHISGGLRSRTEASARHKGSASPNLPTSPPAAPRSPPTNSIITASAARSRAGSVKSSLIPRTPPSSGTTPPGACSPPKIPTSPTPLRAFSYDKADNRLNDQAGNALRAWDYNALNQPVQSDGAGSFALEGYLDRPGRITVNGRPAAMWQTSNFAAALDVQPGSNRVTVVRSSSDNAQVATNSYALFVPTNRSTLTSTIPTGT